MPGAAYLAAVLFRRPKELTLQYAVGEILLPFIGICLAIWFGNWNEDRREASIETATLAEIREGMKTDPQDVVPTRERHGARMEAHQIIIDHFTNDKPWSDSLRISCGRL